MSTVVVLGGAGYIGSHMVKHLSRAGYQVLVVDDLSTGHQDAISGCELIQGDIADIELLDRIYADRDISGTMHFAGLIQVGESVREPSKYYDGNFRKTQALLDAMRRHGANNLVFSSTAAVYGEPLSTLLTETHPKNPVNPYGRSKWMVEQLLEDYSRAYGFRSISLRYFNAAGADPEGQLGERHDPETHLIPRIMQAASGRLEEITVFGHDYPTVDGTCIRDYIHVTDLCGAHELALKALMGGVGAAAYNVGTGKGYSVKEIIDASERVTGVKLPVRYGERRVGDSAMLVAANDKIMLELGWQYRYGDLNQILTHAWAWERQRHGLKHMRDY